MRNSTAWVPGLHFHSSQSNKAVRYSPGTWHRLPIIAPTCFSVRRPSSGRIIRQHWSTMEPRSEAGDAPLGCASVASFHSDTPRTWRLQVCYLPVKGRDLDARHAVPAPSPLSSAFDPRRHHQPPGESDHQMTHARRKGGLPVHEYPVSLFWSACQASPPMMRLSWPPAQLQVIFDDSRLRRPDGLPAIEQR